MAEMTLDALRAKAEKARERTATASRATEAPVGVWSEPDAGRVEVVPCPEGCGGDVEWRSYLIMGRRMPPVPPSCPECYAKAKRAAEEAAEQARLDTERSQREHRARFILDIMAAAGVNTREHGRLTLDDMDTAEMGDTPVRACRDFIQAVRTAGKHDPVRGLYLCGSTGCGKTQLVVATIRELLSDPRWESDHVRLDNAASFITEVQDTYSSDRSTMDVKARRTAVRVWALDDLGTERPTEDAARVLYEILNARAMGPTIVTSNYSPDKLENQHSVLSRVVSRFGPAYFRTVQVRGRDRRFAA